MNYTDRLNWFNKFSFLEKKELVKKYYKILCPDNLDFQSPSKVNHIYYQEHKK